VIASAILIGGAFLIAWGSERWLQLRVEPMPGLLIGLALIPVVSALTKLPLAHSTPYASWDAGAGGVTVQYLWDENWKFIGALFVAVSSWIVPALVAQTVFWIGWLPFLAILPLLTDAATARIAVRLTIGSTTMHNERLTIATGFIPIGFVTAVGSVA